MKLVYFCHEVILNLDFLRLTLTPLFTKKIHQVGNVVTVQFMLHLNDHFLALDFLEIQREFLLRFEVSAKLVY